MDSQLGRGLRFAVLLGVGLGLLAAGALVEAMRPVRELSNAEVMQRARALGMASLSELPRAAPAAPAVSVTILIRTETTLDEVAAMLVQAGAVTDAAGFAHRARESGRTGPFAPGPRTFSRGETADQILSKLGTTGKP